MGWKGAPKPRKIKSPKTDSSTQTYVFGLRADKPVKRVRESRVSKRERKRLMNALQSLEKHANSLYPGTRARIEADQAVEDFKNKHGLLSSSFHSFGNSRIGMDLFSPRSDHRNDRYEMVAQVMPGKGKGGGKATGGLGFQPGSKDCWDCDKDKDGKPTGMKGDKTCPTCQGTGEKS